MSIQVSNIPISSLYLYVSSTVHFSNSLLVCHWISSIHRKKHYYSFLVIKFFVIIIYLVLNKLFLSYLTLLDNLYLPWSVQERCIILLLYFPLYFSCVFFCFLCDIVGYRDLCLCDVVLIGNLYCVRILSILPLFCASLIFTPICRLYLIYFSVSQSPGHHRSPPKNFFTLWTSLPKK